MNFKSVLKIGDVVRLKDSTLDEIESITFIGDTSYYYTLKYTETQIEDEDIMTIYTSVDLVSMSWIKNG